MTTSEERLALFKAEYPHTDNVSLTGADLGVVAGYFVIIVAIGIVVSIVHTGQNCFYCAFFRAALFVAIRYKC